MQLLDLLFPPRCGGCGRHGTAWCPVCASAVEPIDVTLLDGVPLVAAGRLTGPLQRAIHTYKYGRRPRLAVALVQPLVDAIRASAVSMTAVSCVPLHPERLRERGFNQAARLADELAIRLALPRVDGLQRIRPTPAQVGLSQVERRINLLDAFLWKAPSRAPDGLALVDDVCTTGATLEAAAAAVREAGGSIAAFAVLARAQALPGPAVTFPGQSACP